MSTSSVHAALFLCILALLAFPGLGDGLSNATLVSSAKDLASALSNFRVDNIYINGESCFTALAALIGHKFFLPPE